MENVKNNKFCPLDQIIVEFNSFINGLPGKDKTNKTIYLLDYNELYQKVNNAQKLLNVLTNIQNTCQDLITKSTAIITADNNIVYSKIIDNTYDCFLKYNKENNKYLILYGITFNDVTFQGICINYSPLKHDMYEIFIGDMVENVKHGNGFTIHFENSVISYFIYYPNYKVDNEYYLWNEKKYLIHHNKKKFYAYYYLLENAIFFGNFLNDEVNVKQPKFVSAKGCIINNNSFKYKGEFSNNFIKESENGEAIMNDNSDVFRYEGKFVNDEFFNGNIYHSFTDDDNKITQEKGIFLGQLENYQYVIGNYFYSQKENYDGIFKNNLRNGSGKYKYENGDTFIGTWENDKPVSGIFKSKRDNHFIKRIFE
jgi:hypothetical protein